MGEGPYRYVWVVEFPMFDGVDAEGNPVPAHHPFTMPHPDDLDLLETDPAAVRSQAYDLVLNGWELGSGSVRIHRADIQSRVFAALGISAEEAAETASASCSAPSATGRRRTPASPSGSTGWWPSSAGEENIREVIAFPKTQSGADPMTGAPKPLAPTALAELGIRVVAAARGGRVGLRADGRRPLRRRRRGAGWPSRAPLAARLRPRTLDEVVGQRHLVAPGRAAAGAGRGGPAGLGDPVGAAGDRQDHPGPGGGRRSTAKEFVPLSAVASGVKDVREALEGARRRLGERGRGRSCSSTRSTGSTRPSRTCSCPAVEEGLVVLVGATTENPFFEVNAAPHEPDHALAARAALATTTWPPWCSGASWPRRPTADDDAVAALVAAAEGDARSALTTLEVAVALAAARAPGQDPVVTVADVSGARDGRLYHQGADDHYDQASALIKSVRGSDPDAGLYWLARMLEAGEDARFIARRLVILASEDVGMADPTALVVADAAARAVEIVGLPEAALNLAQAVVHLACAPKSNRVTVALARAREDVASGAGGAVPRPPARRPLPRGRRASATARATATPTTTPRAGSTSSTGPRGSRATSTTSPPATGPRPRWPAGWPGARNSRPPGDLCRRRR